MTLRYGSGQGNISIGEEYSSNPNIAFSADSYLGWYWPSVYVSLVLGGHRKCMTHARLFLHLRCNYQRRSFADFLVPLLKRF